MLTVRVSEQVWQAIAGLGKFGEIEDDVLRRVFKLPPNSADGSRPRSPRSPSGPRRRIATQRMTPFIRENQLNIEFEDGASSSWALPDRNDKAGIRAVLNKVTAFARDNGASLGQINAARKTLTSEGYHLTK